MPARAMPAGLTSYRKRFAFHRILAMADKRGSHAGDYIGNAQADMSTWAVILLQVWMVFAAALSYCVDGALLGWMYMSFVTLAVLVTLLRISPAKEPSGAVRVVICSTAISLMIAVLYWIWGLFA